MASITLQGILLDSLGEIDVGAILKFTHLTTTGSTVAGTQVNLIVPPDGAYLINVEYGQIRVDYTSDRTERFVATVVVNSDSTATSIPELLNASVPPTNAQLLQFQAILADAVTAEAGSVAAEAGAVAAEAGAVAAEASILSFNQQTFAGLEALTATIDYSSFICQERANSNYILQPSGYVALSGDATLANGRVAKLQVSFIPNIIQFGGQVSSQSLSGADSGFDNKDAFTSMFTRATSDNYTGEYTLPSGYFRTTEPIDMSTTAVFSSVGQREGFIHADHLNGPAIRFRNSYSGLRDIGVTSSASRIAGAYTFAGRNVGVLYETDDVPEGSTGRVLHSKLKDFYLAGHPDGLLHVVGAAFTGYIIAPDLSGTKGHGIVFDRGSGVGRVNLITGFISGVCNILDGRIGGCAGHSIACGSPTENFSTPALRVVIDNIEGGNNATDPAVRYYNSPYYLRGANLALQNSGSGPTDSGGAMAFIAGRNIHITNNRVLGETANAFVVGSYDELPTDGVYITGFSVISPPASLDPAILVTLPAGETIEPINIHITQGEEGNIVRLVGTDATMGSSDYRRVARIFVNGTRPILYKTTDQIVNNSNSTVSDTALRVWLAPFEKLVFSAQIEYSGTSTSDFKVAIVSPAGSTLSYGPSPTSIKVGSTDSTDIQGLSGGNLAFGASTSARVCTIVGSCVNSSTAGYLNVKWAQLVAEASDTTVHGGASYLEVKSIIT